MIVGIGELLWDVFPDGRKVAGGAPFNFAFHCRQLGHDAVVVSRVGDDDLGHELRAEVRRLGMSDEYIQTDRDRPTGTVRVSVDAAGQPTYTITEDVAWDYIQWSDSMGDIAARARAVCSGTLAQRAAQTRATIQRFLGWRFDEVSPTRVVAPVSETESERSASPPLRIFDVNLRQHFYTPQTIQLSLFLSDWVKLNAAESATLHDMFRPAVQEYDEFLRKLVPLEGRNCVVVTDGSEGARVLSAGVDFREPAVPAHVVDAVGAGDAFTAAMVCLHLEGRPLRECARFANHYAARVCEHRGATPRIDRADVQRAAFG